jgi:hypothetical protein
MPITRSNQLQDVNPRALALLTMPGYDNADEHSNQAPRKRSRNESSSHSSNSIREEVDDNDNNNHTFNNEKRKSADIDLENEEEELDETTIPISIRNIMNNVMKSMLKEYRKYKIIVRKKKISLEKMENFKTSKTFPADINFSYSGFNNCPQSLRNAKDYKDREADIIFQAKKAILENRIDALKEDLSDYRAKFSDTFNAQYLLNKFDDLLPDDFAPPDNYQNYLKQSVMHFKHLVQEERSKLDEIHKRSDERYLNRQKEKTSAQTTTNETDASSQEGNKSQTNNQPNLSRKDLVDLIREVLHTELSDALGNNKSRNRFKPRNKNNNQNKNKKEKNYKTPLDQDRRYNGVNQQKKVQKDYSQKRNSFNNERRSNPKKQYNHRIVEEYPSFSNQRFQKKTYKEVLETHSPKQRVRFADEDWKTVVNKNHRRSQYKQQTSLYERGAGRGKQNRFPNNR